jgi:hypothetical protein
MTYYLTQTEVIKRGWTQGLIDRFLGTPDKEAPNPHCPNPYSRPIKLFSTTRINTYENIPEVWKYIQKTLDRRNIKGKPPKKTIIIDHIIKQELTKRNLLKELKD